MDFKERVYSVLTVSDGEKFSASLSPLLPERTFSPVVRVPDVATAKRAMLEREYDIVLINGTRADDRAAKLAIDVCSDKSSVALLFVKRELYAEIFTKVSDFGVLTVPLPSSPQMVVQALDWARATRERMRRYERSAQTVEQKMEEIRAVNRAKWLLIDVLKMTEADAHRYIEKQAMDRCVSKLEVAKGIINTYK